MANRIKKYVVENFPTWAICYIFNDDPTDLNDDEIQMINDYLEEVKEDLNAKYLHPACCEEEDHFTFYPEFGPRGTMVCETTFLYETK